jgi:hypothetical protein
MKKHKVHGAKKMSLREIINADKFISRGKHYFHKLSKEQIFRFLVHLLAFRWHATSFILLSSTLIRLINVRKQTIPHETEKFS